MDTNKKGLDFIIDFLSPAMTKEFMESMEPTQKPEIDR